ncbi:hypothetical protein D3C81_766250 [compost metagenome]
MQKTIWLSYDLGVKGDYKNLYRWLDNVGAVECGDSLALIKIEISENQVLPDFIKESISSIVNLSSSDRIYIIWKNAEGVNKGRFLFGRRKASPWMGYGDSTSDEDDI